MGGRGGQIVNEEKGKVVVEAAVEVGGWPCSPFFFLEQTKLGEETHSRFTFIIYLFRKVKGK